VSLGESTVFSGGSRRKESLRHCGDWGFPHRAGACGRKCLAGLTDLRTRSVQVDGSGDGLDGLAVAGTRNGPASIEIRENGHDAAGAD
jgi:hypothetical protein